nr:MAG TPA: hypothetical protein [Caudoviricetes sp.]
MQFLSLSIFFLSNIFGFPNLCLKYIRYPTIVNGFPKKICEIIVFSFGFLYIIYEKVVSI